MYATKATIAGLVAHINAQPASRNINHLSWETCAVGNYCHEVLGREAHNDIINQKLSPDTPLGELWAEAGSCQPNQCSYVREVDHESLIDVLQIAGAKGWDTYGRLRNGLARKFPEMGFVPVETNWFKRLIAGFKSKFKSDPNADAAAADFWELMGA